MSCQREIAPPLAVPSGTGEGGEQHNNQSNDANLAGRGGDGARGLSVWRLMRQLGEVEFGLGQQVVARGVTSRWSRSGLRVESGLGFANR